MRPPAQWKVIAIVLWSENKAMKYDEINEHSLMKKWYSLGDAKFLGNQTSRRVYEHVPLHFENINSKVRREPFIFGVNSASEAYLLPEGFHFVNETLTMELIGTDWEITTELRDEKSELVGDIKLESSNYFGNEPLSLPSSPVSPSPPPTFRLPQPKAPPPANSAPNSPSLRKTGPRKPEVGFVYIRAVFSVDTREEFRLSSSFKHGLFGEGQEDARRSSGYTDLPPFDENSLWLGSEFVAVAGPFTDMLLAERQFSNQLVPIWNIQIGIGKQKEWHSYRGDTHEKRREELVQITSELSSFAMESGVNFEYRPIFDLLCS